MLFGDIRSLVLLRQVFFHDFEAFAVALEDGSRDELKFYLLALALRIAVMPSCQNEVRADKASSSMA